VITGAVADVAGCGFASTGDVGDAGAGAAGAGVDVDGSEGDAGVDGDEGVCDESCARTTLILTQSVKTRTQAMIPVEHRECRRILKIVLSNVGSR
jgi:hypothetical protein